jgi:transcriptional regulator with XRE-family HTH domain
MKMGRAEIADLRKRLQFALEKQQLTAVDIGRLAGVHPSQVGRICRGEFRTMSHNVMEVCRVLGVDAAAQPASESDAAWALLERNLQKLWEESPDRARRMAKLMEAMTQLALE